MTDTERLQKEKLQKLFQAALVSACEEKVTLARAYPKSTLATLAARAAVPSAPLAPGPVAAPVAAARDFIQPLQNCRLGRQVSESPR